jgi:hypothetical protein
LVKHGALPEERIRAVETGGCPHAAIREDISINLGPLEELSNLYKADLLLCESGGGISLVEFNNWKFYYHLFKPVYCPSWCNSEDNSPTRIISTMKCLKNVL